MTEPAASGRDTRGFVFLAAMAAVMWLTEMVDQVADGRLDRQGIVPRETYGLDGIVFAAFLHGDFDHLIGNTFPFLALGALIALGGLAQVAAVTVVIAAVGGLGTWLVAPSNTVHIGASGIVFGYAAFLVARGLYSRSLLHLAVGVGVVAVWGATMLAGLLPEPGISWQGHLFGAVGGVVAAALRYGRENEDT